MRVQLLKCSWNDINVHRDEKNAGHDLLEEHIEQLNDLIEKGGSIISTQLTSVPNYEGVYQTLIVYVSVP